MTYGYDSAWLFSRSQSNIDDFARDLLSRLHFGRKSPLESERPILFICHSLGGVVFKQALITASSQLDHYGGILKSVRGAVFMGTPHRGSRTAGTAKLLSKIINTVSFGTAIRSDLLGVLKVSSKSLEDISLQSISLLKELRIVSFYEQKPLGISLVCINHLTPRLVYFRSEFFSNGFRLSSLSLQSSDCQTNVPFPSMPITAKWRTTRLIHLNPITLYGMLFLNSQRVNSN
jgi:hypothetical protein